MSNEIKAATDYWAIPWCMDSKNPDVIERKAKSLVRIERDIKEAHDRRMVKPLMVCKPAKSAARAKSKPVAPKSKPAATLAPVKPKAVKYADDAVITVLVDKFPHKPGSQAEAKSALLLTGMTVAEYHAAGSSLGLKGNWHIAHIRYCLGYNYISLEG